MKKTLSIGKKTLIGKINYTGTKEEFRARYPGSAELTLHSTQCLGANAFWKLDDGVLTIYGHGSTIDLLNW